MKPMSLATLVLASSLSLAATLAPAHADIRPPPLERVQPKTPAAVKMWALGAKNAMKNKDMAHAKSLCEARGFDENLVGGSGTKLASLFEQGARKGFHLRVVEGDTKLLPRDKGAIVHAYVRDDVSGEDLDELWLLLVVTPDAAGQSRWLALGAGEDKAQVQALSARWLAGGELAPPQEKGSPSE